MYSYGIRALPLRPEDKVAVNPSDEMKFGKIHEQEFKTERTLSADEERMVVNAIASQHYFEGTTVTYAGADKDNVVVQYMTPHEVRALPDWAFAIIIMVVIAAIVSTVISYCMVKLVPGPSFVLENINPFTSNILLLGVGVALLVGGLWVVTRIFAPEVEWFRGVGERRRTAKAQKEYEKRRKKEQWRAGYL